MLFYLNKVIFCLFRCVISTLTKMSNFYGSIFTLIMYRNDDSVAIKIFASKFPVDMEIMMKYC